MLAASSERPLPPRPEASAISLARARGASTGSDVSPPGAGPGASSSVTTRSSSPWSMSSIVTPGPPLIFELDVPVGRIGDAEERQPLAVANPPAVGAEGRRPSRPQGRLHQLQPRLVGRARPLGQVAVDAAADDVLPGGAAALGPRHHMVQVQLRARQLATAV